MYIVLYYTHTHMYTHTYIHTYIHTYLPTYLPNLTYLPTYLPTLHHSYILYISPYKAKMLVALPPTWMPAVWKAAPTYATTRAFPGAPLKTLGIHH